MGGKELGMTKPAKGNGFDPDEVKDYVARIEEIDEDIASATGKHMAHCKSLRQNIAEIYDEAKEAGVPKKLLKKNVARRKLEAKIEDLREELEEEERETYDQIRLALGDLAELPLGQAALDLDTAA
jgi:F0F1-type ATP synthase membrane subunit b/b'